ncbi:hypothetical protein PIN31009_05275 [Pandoraea iniqua]|uniref:antiviral reverse transcriptase Drt2 n=1 Tax=Pandoraea iniqua TaxID=2508288 RepID=UPI001241D61D|nr:antiviral reverse transcriptase Drt2 [Pandoraea iniqua]VVE58303.1 hypothetical protein PIN31009_05275 [Pandoraea iniqua]
MNKRAEWFRRRRYLHFDLPISERAATAIVENPDIVGRHSFYPFVNFVITSAKVKWDAGMKRLVTTPKERSVSYASHVDSHIYAFYASMLDRLYEERLRKLGCQSAVLAFRKLGKSNIHFAKDAFDSIKSIGDADVITADFSDFFGNLDHKIIKSAWCDLIGVKALPKDHYNVFKSITKFCHTDKRNLYAALGISMNNPGAFGARLCTPELFRAVVRGCGLIERNPHPKGIPQGAPISALLSNIYMLQFDMMVWDAVTAAGGRYFRYCDDMIVIVPKGSGKDMLSLVRHLSDIYKLPLHPKKTEERSFVMTSSGLDADKPLQYLGFLFDGKQVILRSASLARYSDRMRRGVRLARLTMRSKNELRTARGETPVPLKKRKLYKRYSYLGRRNFVSYALRAAKILDTRAIKRQVKPLWRRLKQQMA